MNEFYKDIFNNQPEGTAICDSDNTIIDVNEKFTKISGYTKDELTGKNILEIINPSRSACNVCPDDSEDDGKSAFQLGELKDKKNQLTCIRINQSKTSDNKTIYVIIPFADIAFLNQAHIDFVSTVSHELRTPLTSIKGFAETLLSAGDNLNKEQQTRFISIIKSQIDRLARLVENLLTVSKLEARQSKSIYKAIDVKDIIESILTSLQHKSENHTIEVDIQPNIPPVWADQDKLEQVLMNLVDNAIKYSNPETTVNIVAKFLKQDSEKIEIKIKDQGYGIPEEHLSKIFTKFSRIDSPLTRQVQGTGLGLYITKSLVNSIKGDITAESNDQGSTFTITLPAISPEVHAKQRFQERN